MADSDGDANTGLPFRPDPVPRHIAIVMDGNGRWARSRGRPRAFGHEAGARAVRPIVEACGDWGVEALTLYTFSTENWNRPEAEVKALMRLLRGYLKKETDELDRQNVRLRAIGDLDRLPKAAREELDRARERLAANTGLTLVLALSYGGRDEIVRAVRSLAARAARGEIDPGAIDETMLSAALDTGGLPDPELVIRTAGEMRLSNFLLWQASYAEYFATPICWPDFTPERLAEAISHFQARVRKFGRVVES